MYISLLDVGCMRGTITAVLNLFLIWILCAPLQSVPWRMRPIRMGLRHRWSVTAVCVHAATGSAPPWPAMVRRGRPAHLYRHTGSSTSHLNHILGLQIRTQHLSFSLSNRSCNSFILCISFLDKTAVVEETGEAGQEMTEEEWSLRVTELNKHQVSLSPRKQLVKVQRTDQAALQSPQTDG